MRIDDIHRYSRQYPDVGLVETGEKASMQHYVSDVYMSTLAIKLW